MCVYICMCVCVCVYNALPFAKSHTARHTHTHTKNKKQKQKTKTKKQTNKQTTTGINKLLALRVQVRKSVELDPACWASTSASERRKRDALIKYATRF